MRTELSTGTLHFPACVDADQAARFFGFPAYFMPVLVRSGHLKPLGRPSQNSRRWFATVELERHSRDAAWLDKAVRIVEKHVQDANKKQRGRSIAPAPPIQPTAIQEQAAA